MKSMFVEMSVWTPSDKKRKPIKPRENGIDELSPFTFTSVPGVPGLVISVQTQRKQH